MPRGPPAPARGAGEPLRPAEPRSWRLCAAGCPGRGAEARGAAGVCWVTPPLFPSSRPAPTSGGAGSRQRCPAGLACRGVCGVRGVRGGGGCLEGCVMLCLLWVPTLGTLPVPSGSRAPPRGPGSAFRGIFPGPAPTLSWRQFPALQKDRKSTEGVTPGPCGAPRLPVPALPVRAAGLVTAISTRQRGPRAQRGRRGLPRPPESAVALGWPRRKRAPLGPGAVLPPR